MYNINYELNENGTLKSWISVPILNSLPKAQVEDNYIPKINLDKVLDGMLIKASSQELETYKHTQLKKREIMLKISLLKSELAKAKEDVEQVELFGIERTDYSKKKARCKDIVLELKKLEELI